MIAQRWQWLREACTAAFDDVSLEGSPKDWSVEGERYLGITAAVRKWAARRGDIRSGAGIYAHLSHYGHPQGLAGRDDARVDATQPTGTAMETDVPHLARLGSTALAAWLNGFVLLTHYHGFDHPSSDAIVDAAVELTRRGSGA